MTDAKREKEAGDDFVEDIDDVVGTWDGEGTIYFRPKAQRISPNKRYKNKDTIFIVGVAMAPCSAINRDKEQVEISAGDSVGVFYRPGMRKIFDYGECRIKMRRDESLDKDVDQGNPMKGYRIVRHKADKPQPLFVQFDYRLGKKTPPRAAVSADEKAFDADGEDIPF